MTTRPYEIKRLGVIDDKTIMHKLGKNIKNNTNRANKYNFIDKNEF